jgi:LacI family transcriptional regulator
MVRRRVTIRDVARKAGVHASTVSRVLNPETRSMISREIAVRVTGVAATLGYRANPIAYGLKTNRSRTVGVLVPDITNPVFPPILRAIEDVFAEAGYTAILANTDNDRDRERAILGNMIARRVDGLIMATALRRDPLVDQCLAEEIPLVLVNRTVERREVPSVVNDDELGTRMAVAHLAGLGHRRIAYLAGPTTLSTGHARHRGFLGALRTAGLAAEPELVVFCDAFTENAGRRAFADLWGRDRGFTALVAGNDMLALGCYDALLDLGVRVPEEVSVIGFNDMPFVGKLHPPLTTVRIPLSEIGARAARALLGRLRDRAAPVERIVLEPELVVRASTAPPRAARARRPGRS